MQAFSEAQNTKKCTHSPNCHCADQTCSVQHQENDELLQLQRMIGNQGMQQLLQPGNQAADEGQGQHLTQSTAANKSSMVDWIWRYFKRSGCSPGFLTALMKQTGRGCQAKAVIYVSYEQCVKKSKCSEKEQLKHIQSFGDMVCQLFCAEKNCKQKSHFQAPHKCGTQRCWRPGIKYNPCAKACPYYAGCSNNGLARNAVWNCHCSAPAPRVS